MSQNRNLSGCQVFHADQVPAEWECDPLGDRTEFCYGRALKDELRKDGHVVVYGSNGSVGTHNVEWLQAPGIVIGRKGSVGAVHFAKTAYWPIDTAYYVKASAGDDLGYLYYLLHYLPLTSLNAATGVPGLSRRDVYALRGAFPRQPSEQAAIARILDAVDNAIERTRAAVDEALGLKRAVLRRFFYDALGETAYANRPYKKLPDGWKLMATEELLAEEPKNGVSPKASSQPPGVPTFSIAAVRNGRVDLSGGHLKYARLADKVARKFQVARGDLLVVRGNANPDLVGKAGMIADFPEGCIYPDITKRVVFKTEGEHTVTSDYAVLAWNHPIVHNQIARRAKTSNGTLKINTRDVKQIILPIPPKQAQKDLVALVAAVETKADALKAKLVALEQLKKSLMHDLLTGRVRVPADAATEI